MVGCPRTGYGCNLAKGRRCDGVGVTNTDYTMLSATLAVFYTGREVAAQLKSASESLDRMLQDVKRIAGTLQTQRRI